MNNKHWISWQMQTARNWQDISGIMKEVNIEFIDYDHRMLLEYALELNQLIDRLEMDFSLDTLQEIGHLLHDLQIYAIAHFERERVFMENYHLPAIGDHLTEHNRILATLDRTMKDYEHGKINISHDLKHQIMRWLMNHINETDYVFFDIKNWQSQLSRATGWDSVKEIICDIGIREIDEQHRELTETAIDVMNTVVELSSKEAIDREVDLLIQVVKKHFDFETAFMRQYAMEDLESHDINHGYFLQRLETIGDEIATSQKTPEEVKVWLLTWWISHINKTDKHTFAYQNWAYKVIEKTEAYSEVSNLLRMTELTGVDNDHLKVMGETLILNGMIKEGLMDKKDDGEAKKTILAKFDEIYGIAERHFQREERIMSHYGLKDTQNHFKEHKDILNRLLTIRENYVSGRLMVSENIKTTILEWWLHHTNTIDYRTFVKQMDPNLVDRINLEEHSESV